MLVAAARRYLDRLTDVRGTLLPRMADHGLSGTPGTGGVPSLSPAQEAGPDLPSREGVPNWVAQGDEQRWRDSGTVAEQLLGDDATPDQVWSLTRVAGTLRRLTVA
jgi:hypothetical protein